MDVAAGLLGARIGAKLFPGVGGRGAGGEATEPGRHGLLRAAAARAEMGDLSSRQDGATHIGRKARVAIDKGQAVHGGQITNMHLKNTI